MLVRRPSQSAQYLVSHSVRRYTRRERMRLLIVEQTRCKNHMSDTTIGFRHMQSLTFLVQAQVECKAAGQI